MHNRLFAHLGEQALLRVIEPCVVNIEYGVVVNYESGDNKFTMSEYAATVDIANIQNTSAPAVGDSLNILAPDGITVAKHYIIDALASDNGFMSRWILRGA